MRFFVFCVFKLEMRVPASFPPHSVSWLQHHLLKRLFAFGPLDVTGREAFSLDSDYTSSAPQRHVVPVAHCLGCCGFVAAVKPGREVPSPSALASTVIFCFLASSRYLVILL